MQEKIKKGILRIRNIASMAILASLLLANAYPAFAQVMSSSNYQIQSDSVNTGGSLSASASFSLEDTAGEIATGRSSGTSLSVNAGYQQSDSVGGPVDVTPPSVPAGLSATGLTTTSIQLAWTASTDNVAVVGYRIYRDGVFITTTPLLTYDDTGLAISTSYLYNVAAYDAAGNISAWSATTTGTTLDDAAPTPGTTGGGGNAALSIYDVRLEAGTDRIDLSWRTNIQTMYNVSWGTTKSYEGGSVSGMTYANNHSVAIPNLVPGTRYYIRIDVADQIGRSGRVDGLQITTLALPVSDQRSNVTDFTATGDEDSINLEWANPSAADFEAVRIVRSEEFYPVDPNEGVVIYDGPAEQFDDTNVEEDVTYYYTAFARYADGEYSSGAVAHARIGEAGENPLENLPPATGVDPQIAGLTLSDFDFIQDGKSVPIFDGDKVLIDGMKDLRIMLRYDKVPEVLKTVAVTFAHPDSPTRQFSFLLRINSDKTAYEAVIAPLERAGAFALHIAIVDHKNRGMKQIEGNVLAAATHVLKAVTVPVSDIIAYLALLILKLSVLVGLLVILIRKLREEFKERHHTHAS